MPVAKGKNPLPWQEETEEREKGYSTQPHPAPFLTKKEIFCDSSI